MSLQRKIQLLSAEFKIIEFQASALLSHSHVLPASPQAGDTMALRLTALCLSFPGWHSTDRHLCLCLAAFLCPHWVLSRADCRAWLPGTVPFSGRTPRAHGRRWEPSQVLGLFCLPSMAGSCLLGEILPFQTPDPMEDYPEGVAGGTVTLSRRHCVV